MRGKKNLSVKIAFSYRPSAFELQFSNLRFSVFLGVGTFRRPPVHGLPKWTTLKIPFRMSTVDPRVRSISNLSIIVVMADYFR